MIAYHDLQRRFYRKAYFTEFRPDYRSAGPGRPRWRWSTSIGTGFDSEGRLNENDPILFVRFTDEDQKVLVSRQPLTAAALFETRAVYAEIDHDARTVAGKGEGSPEWKKFNLRQQEMFYDQSLTLYSAPAHIVASQAGITDPIDAYRLAAKAAGIVLNLTPELELDCELPKRFAGEALGRARRLQEILDLGYIFAALAVSAPKYEGDDDAWLNGALAKVGLPSSEYILDAACKYLSLPTSNEPGDLMQIYLNAVSAGIGNFQRLRGSYGLLDFEHMTKCGTNYGPMALPHVVLANDALAASLMPVISLVDQRTMSNASRLLHDHLDEFLDACR
ncbi:hypothetical protein E2C06_20050 [Dankookia rubra]|uniref:Uncharacterized protein n=1 Tax=Dankookia rubra TaxID=1442381 RepID=A0A4R5QDB0_9PROT|nr:hypothetical protein [Dankookia rubra]TDH60793.1 hypothetical protein E2C06_20050 [Dankookia rubra]